MEKTSLRKDNDTTEILVGLLHFLGILRERIEHEVISYDVNEKRDQLEWIGPSNVC